MIKTNYHTHSKLSDGFFSINEIAEAAINENFKILGFSEHSPVFFPSNWNMKLENLNEYIQQVKKTKENFKNEIQILCGIEADFFQNKKYISFWKNFNIDYTIGSVHYLPLFFDYNTPFNIDKNQNTFDEGLKIFFDNNIKSMLKLYYEQVADMLQNDTPDIVAHLDQIAKFNKNYSYFNPNDKWYLSIIDEVLNVIKNKNTVLEINCRSKYRKILNDFSPMSTIIKMAYEKKIPMTISGDIHKIKEFSYFWNDAIEALKKMNIKEIYFLDTKGWHSQTI
jgi:histidinol-phosphatase (PHP family)